MSDYPCRGVWDRTPVVIEREERGRYRIMLPDGSHTWLDMSEVMTADEAVAEWVRKRPL